MNNSSLNMNRLLDHDPIKSFVGRCQDIINKDGLFGGDILSIQSGRKYWKIVVSRENSNQTSVWAFVDKTTGDIFKAATRNAPAKHARGNIHADDGGMSRMTVHGPEYLK